jgi:DNA-binding IclR family transcriptional regulator
VRQSGGADCDESVAGAQSVHRALALLRLVGAHHPEGVKPGDLIAATGLQRSTAHRLIACLVQEGFVERDPATRCYRLGIEAMQFGLAWGGGAPLIERCRPAMQRLARESGDTVFLIVRAGDHALCLHREEGAYPIKAFVVDTGMRRLLGLSAVGVAMMARLDDAEWQAIVRRSSAEYAQLGVSQQMLRDLVESARQKGYSETTDWRTRETSGVGRAFPISAHMTIGISIAAVNSRMKAERRRLLARQIGEEVRALAWTDRT